MKNFLLLFPTIILVASSCQSKQTLDENLVRNVTETEILVNSHDSILQILLQNGLQDSIPALTQQTLAVLSANLTELQSLNSSSEKASNLKKAAIVYTGSLIGIVKAQDIYCNYNDTISLQDASNLDYLNVDAVKNAQRRQMQYNECLRAFPATK